jgi:hypothetical protein
VWIKRQAKNSLSKNACVRTEFFDAGFTTHSQDWLCCRRGLREFGEPWLNQSARRTDFQESGGMNAASEDE